MDQGFLPGGPNIESELVNDVGAHNPISDHDPKSEGTGGELPPPAGASIVEPSTPSQSISFSWSSWIRFIVFGIVFLMSVPALRPVSTIVLFAAFVYFEGQSIWKTFFQNTEYRILGISGFYAGLACLAGSGFFYFVDHWDAFIAVVGQK